MYCYIDLCIGIGLLILLESFKCLKLRYSVNGLLPKRKSQTNLGEVEDKRCQLFEP